MHGSRTCAAAGPCDRVRASQFLELEFRKIIDPPAGTSSLFHERLDEETSLLSVAKYITSIQIENPLTYARHDSSVGYIVCLFSDLHK